MLIITPLLRVAWYLTTNRGGPPSLAREVSQPTDILDIGLLGHKSPVMTQRYAHHYPESQRDGVEVLDRPRPISTNLTQPLSRIGEVLLTH